MLEALFGLSSGVSGEITLNRKKVLNRTPRESKKNGFILVTEERLRNGIFRNQNIVVNTTIANLDSYKNGVGWIYVRSPAYVPDDRRKYAVRK